MVVGYMLLHQCIHSLCYCDVLYLCASWLTAKRPSKRLVYQCWGLHLCGSPDACPPTVTCSRIWRRLLCTGSRKRLDYPSQIRAKDHSSWSRHGFGGVQARSWLVLKWADPDYNTLLRSTPGNGAGEQRSYKAIEKTVRMLWIFYLYAEEWCTSELSQV